MFITKSEKKSLVETSLNLGEKVLKLEKELDAIKTILKKSPSWAWVENLEKKSMAIENRIETSAKNQVKKNTEIMASVKIMEEKVESNRKFIHDVFAEVLARDAKRMDKIAFSPADVKVEVKKPTTRSWLLNKKVEEKSTQKLVIAKKRGRPLGSKNKAK
jgi:hypothetical protein